jgi:hypothetical protein
VRPFYLVGAIVGFLIVGSPTIASANFAWPPLIYAYTYKTWWVVLPGLLIEWVVYFVAWRFSLIRTTMLTLAVNAGSAAAGLAYVLVSLAFLRSEVVVLMVGFIWASPLLIFAATVAAEYLVATRLFALPRSWKTLAIFVMANVPSVGLALYGTVTLTGQALRGGA